MAVAEADSSIPQEPSDKRPSPSLLTPFGRQSVSLTGFYIWTSRVWAFSNEKKKVVTDPTSPPQTNPPCFLAKEEDTIPK